MSTSEKLYRYTIPGSHEVGLCEPDYDIKTNGEVRDVTYTANDVSVVQTEATPHYHKDSVNVTVEKISESDLDT